MIARRMVFMSTLFMGIQTKKLFPMERVFGELFDESNDFREDLRIGDRKIGKNLSVQGYALNVKKVDEFGIG
jgi:hypothetical protein